MYDVGEAVSRNDGEAIKWFRKAAEKVDCEASHELGRRYSIGDRVLEDYVEAVRWYRKRAEIGCAEA